MKKAIVAALALAASTFAARAAEKPAAFAPPPESAIPNGELGSMIKLGEAIFTDTGTYAGAFVGNALKCSNCHLGAGRLANSAPLAQAYVAYPAYRAKDGRVITFEERLQGCFRYSMNGRAPPAGNEVLTALATYAFFLATNAPTGASLPGRGYPVVGEPPLPRDYGRGEKLFAAKCSLCHGADGLGQKGPDGATVFPALWGPESFNWGAGMGSIKNAAGFVKANMPLGQGWSLSDQEAWDVATFMDSHDRPQDPRFVKDVATTRAMFHDPADSMYGALVNGVILGRPPLHIERGVGAPGAIGKGGADAD